MSKNIIVLGAGLVGSAMAIDLSKQHAVIDSKSTQMRWQKAVCRHGIQTSQADCRMRRVESLVQD